MLHHVRIAAPPGSEAVLRGFYGALGLVEFATPPVLAPRVGGWFRLGGAELHVGVEEPSVPARKTHPAVEADVEVMARSVIAAGASARWADEREWAGSRLAGLRRFHTEDPVGNRLELISR